MSVGRRRPGDVTLPCAPEGFEIGRERGFFVRLSADAPPVEQTPFPSGLRRGPVALITDSTPLLRRLATALDRRDLGCSFAVVPDAAGRPSLGAALDAAARHPDIAAILIAIDTIDEADAFADVARRVAHHLPILCVAYGGDDDPFRQPWVERLGLIAMRTLHDAVDAMPFMVDLEPPTDRRCCILTPSEGLGRYLRARITAAGYHVEQGTESGPDALDDALGRTEWDIVVAVADEPSSEPDREAVVSRVAAARRRHEDIPCVVVANGSAGWPGFLRRALAPVGIPVIETGAEVEHGLRALSRWARPRPDATVARQTVRDAGRLRKAIRALRAPGASAFGQTIQREILGAMGLPGLTMTAVRYLEDSLIAAADLGYPVRIAAQYPGQDWGRPPRWQDASDSEALIATGQSLLAEAQRNAPGQGELLIAPAQGSSGALLVEASRHPQFGPVAAVATGSGTCFGVVPLAPDRLDAQLALGERFGKASPVALEGVTAAARAACGVIDTCADATAVRLEVEVLTGGFVARDVAIRLESE